MRRNLIIAAVAWSVASACSGTSSGPASAPSSTPAVTGSPSTSPSPSPRRVSQDWTTYHGDSQRSGYADVAPLRRPLGIAWSHDFGAAVYAQPIVVGPVTYVATEHDDVIAMRTTTGRIVWRQHLGSPVPRSALPCGNIDPLGITGTPAYDPNSHEIYVVTETTGARHDLHALDARTGQQRWSRNVDVGGHDHVAQQQRAALLLADNRVYVAFGGLDGDCGDYVGYVAAVSTDGEGAVLHYAVPTSREGGIWSAPGPVQAKTGVDVFVSTGNGASTGGSYDGSDSVIDLSPTLHRRGLFAPSTWADDNAHDLDLGSMAPVVVPATGAVLAAGKRGTVYLAGAPLGGVGSDQTQIDGCAAYGGAAFTGQTVILPCSNGIRRLDVGLRQLRWRWQLGSVAGSPVIARDVVYSLDLTAGDLVEVDLATGHARTRVHVGAVSRFATPVPVNGVVLVGTMTGVVAVSGR